MKTNQTFLKFLAVVLPVIAAITLLAVISIASDIGDRMEYDNYYSYEITDAFAEKQDDGRYLITAVIKNNSAYQTIIDKNSVQVMYGNHSYLDNQISLYDNTDIYETLNKFFIPAGRSIEYPILIELPEEVRSVTLSYYGDSYNLRNITDEDNQKFYKVKL